MDRRSFLRPFVVVATLLAALGFSGGDALPVATAQATIECAPAATPAATPATDASPVPEEIVAFPADGELTIFAAASLTAAFDQVLSLIHI